jgi:hypothetical protein
LALTNGGNAAEVVDFVSQDALVPANSPRAFGYALIERCTPALAASVMVVPAQSVGAKRTFWTHHRVSAIG